MCYLLNCGNPADRDGLCAGHIRMLEEWRAIERDVEE